MTYSLDHAKEVQHLTTLLDTLGRDLSEMRQMVSVCGDALDMPGRTPDVDADGTGRKATTGPSRPTERIALDDSRAALYRELNTGAQHVIYATAYVRGATAAMDRALARWEGEEPVLVPGETHDDHADWPAEDV